MSAETAKLAIEANAEVVEFGTAAQAVDAMWIDKAQDVLGVTFSESYLWFLKNYGGGEIGGDEVYSLYGMPFEDVNGGDIVYQHLTNLKNGQQQTNYVAVTETDFGETYLFNYAKYDGTECPVYVQLGNAEPTHFADDFYEFIIKRIEQFTS